MSAAVYSLDRTHISRPPACRLRFVYTRSLACLLTYLRYIKIGAARGEKGGKTVRALARSRNPRERGEVDRENEDKFGRCIVCAGTYGKGGALIRSVNEGNVKRVVYSIF